MLQDPLEINLREAFLNAEDQRCVAEWVKSSQEKISMSKQAPLVLQGLFKPGERPKLSDNLAQRVQQELDRLHQAAPVNAKVNSM